MSSRALILLCEDNREDMFLVRNAFAQAGFAHSIVEVRNGQQAVNYLSGAGLYADRMKHPLPDLVLLDLRMPMMDGFEVLAWLKTRADLSRLPVVVLTVSSVSDDMERARKLGAQEYLVKPNDWDGLVKAIQNLCEKYMKTPQDQPPTTNLTGGKDQGTQPGIEGRRPRL